MNRTLRTFVALALLLNLSFLHASYEYRKKIAKPASKHYVYEARLNKSQTCK